MACGRDRIVPTFDLCTVDELHQEDDGCHSRHPVGPTPEKETKEVCQEVRIGEYSRARSALESNQGFVGLLSEGETQQLGTLPNEGAKAGVALRGVVRTTCIVGVMADAQNDQLTDSRTWCENNAPNHTPQ